MEAIGLAFAAFSLFSELEACGKSLCRFSRDIRMAKKEVKLLKYEIANCRVLASIFEEVISPVQNNVMRLAKEKGLDRRLRDQSKLAHEQIREITHKLRPLHRGKSTGLAKFRAKIRWHFTKDDFQFPMATLETVKSSLGLLTSLSMLDTAITNFDQIPKFDSIRKSKALERITALEKQTRRTERQFSDAIRVLHEQNPLDGHLDGAENIQVITVIIKEIRKGPVNDARTLIKRFSNQAQARPPIDPHLSSELTSADEMYLPSPGPVRVFTTQYLSGPKSKDSSIRSRSFTRDSIRVPAKDLAPVGSELERENARDNSPVCPRHGDVVTVESEINSSGFHASDDIVTFTPRSFSAWQSMGQAMPPFTESDRQEREMRSRRRHSRSRSQRGE